MSNTGTSFAFILIVLILGLVSANFDLLSAGKYFLAQAGSSIGVNASVPPNPFNTLAQQLAEREEELNSREQSLAEREKDQDITSPRFIYMTMGALSFLMLIHLYLDHKRNRQIEIA